MSVGQKLRQSRKDQNISLRQVANETKIGMVFLDALERDDIDSLPGGVYGKTFLRSYCRFLNLDEDNMIDEFHQQFDITPQSKLILDENERDNQRFIRRRRNMSIFIGIVFLVLLIVAVLLLRSYASASNEDPRPVTEQNLPEDLPPASSELQLTPVTESDQGGESPPPMVDHGPEKDGDISADPPDPTPQPTAQDDESSLPCADPNVMIPVDGKPADRIEDIFAIQARDEVWVEVEIDGDPITRRMMQSGEVRFYQYGQENRVNIGDVSKISIQDGRTYRQSLTRRPVYPGWIEFAPGAFAETIAEAVQNQIR